MDIRLDKVSYKYKGTRREVLSNYSLELHENTICGLLGKNGVGKTTTLYLMAGLLRPTSGSVTIGGMEAKRRQTEMLQDVFIVADEFNLPKMSLREYVSINAPFYPRFSEEMLHECLAEFELASDINLAELSMGEKKKVYISFALATGTRVLLMDEPTNGLDIPAKGQFRKNVSRSMSDDRLIIISTHQVHDVEQLLDHIVIISEDGILLNASTEQLTSDYVFETRTLDDMVDAIYAEPSLQGNLVMAPRGSRPETPLNLELLFNAVTAGRNKE